MDSQIALLVFLSSAAGWYGGFWFERRRARKTFADFSRRLSLHAMEATTIMARVMYDMIKKISPDVAEKQIMQELCSLCNEQGLQMVTMSGEQFRKVFGCDNDNDQTK